MKTSSIFLMLTIIIACISIFLFVENENAQPKSIDEIQKFTGLNQIFVNRGLPGVIESYRESKRNNILTLGGISFLLAIMLYAITKNIENKRDPLKNLDKLRENKIISESEYVEKQEYTKKVIADKKIEKKSKKEAEKLISELDNLKNKGILTQEEYEEKIIKININKSDTK